MAIFLGLLLAVVVAFVVVSRHPLRLEHHRTLVEEPLSRLVGFAVTVNGPVYVSLSPHPVLTLHDVHLADADADDASEALTVGTMRVQIAALPRLFGHWAIRRLDMDDVELCISPTPKSACNWNRVVSALDEVTSLGRVSVTNLHVTCRGGLCGKGMKQDIARVSALAWPHLPVQLRLTLHRSDKSPLLTFTGGTWSDLRADHEWPIRAETRFAGADIKVKGKIDRPREADGLSLDVDAEARSLKLRDVRLGALLVHGRLVGRDNGLEFHAEHGRLGPGEFKVDVRADKMEHGFAAKLVSEATHLDLDPWLEAPTHGRGAGGYINLSVDLNATGETLKALTEHTAGSIRVLAGPAELPIDEVERWSKGLLHLVLAFPAEGTETHINCIGGPFTVKNGRAASDEVLIDTENVHMRAVGWIELRNNQMDFIVKAQFKEGPIRKAPLVQVTGTIEHPVAQVAPTEIAKNSLRGAVLADPIELPKNPDRPCD